jgi:chromate transporter
MQLPDPASIRPAALAITAIAVVSLFRLRWSVLRTLGMCSLLGIAATAAGLAV